MASADLVWTITVNANSECDSQLIVPTSIDPGLCVGVVVCEVVKLERWQLIAKSRRASRHAKKKTF